jgi:hypothetical protein
LKGSFYSTKEEPTKWFMNLRSPTEDENGEFISAWLSFGRHSRAGGNPGSFSGRVSLDTRFRGYDEHRRLRAGGAAQLFSKELTKHTKLKRVDRMDSTPTLNYDLRELRILRGEIFTQ